MFAKVSWNPGKRDDSFPIWKGVYEDGKNESGTLVYGVMKAKGEGEDDKSYTIEAYESESYLWDVHVKSPGVQHNMKTTPSWRYGLEHDKLKVAGGFWSR